MKRTREELQFLGGRQITQKCVQIVKLDQSGASFSGAVGQDLHQHSVGREATKDVREAEFIRGRLLVLDHAHRRAFLLLNKTTAR